MVTVADDSSLDLRTVDFTRGFRGRASDAAGVRVELHCRVREVIQGPRLYPWDGRPRLPLHQVRIVGRAATPGSLGASSSTATTSSSVMASMPGLSRHDRRSTPLRSWGCLDHGRVGAQTVAMNLPLPVNLVTVTSSTDATGDSDEPLTVQ